MFKYAVELNLNGLHSPLGFTVVLGGEGALEPYLLGLSIPEHARDRLLKMRGHLFPGFIRAVSVLVQTHPKRHLHHQLIPPRQVEALDLADYSEMTGLHEGAHKKCPSNLNKCTHPTDALIPPTCTT